MNAVVVSWNVHGFVGTDGTRDPERTLAAIAALDADVVAIQEAEGSDWQGLAEDCGFQLLVGPTKARCFGNAILARLPIERHRTVDLSRAGREPRGALEAVIVLPEGPLRVVTTHLGLRAGERLQQARLLSAHLRRWDAGAPTVLVGDFNDWTPWGAQLRPLSKVVGRLSRLPTFPSSRPVLPLDRAALRGPGIRRRVAVVRGRAFRRASDHLPLRMHLGNAGSAPT